MAFEQEYGAKQHDVQTQMTLRITEAWNYWDLKAQ